MKDTDLIKEILLSEVVSNGCPGLDYIEILTYKGFVLGDTTRDLLESSDFNVSLTGGIKLMPAIIQADEFLDYQRTESNIRKRAKEAGYITPPPELAPILREKLSREALEELGFQSLIVMHEPIKDSGDPDNWSNAQPNLRGNFHLFDIRTVFGTSGASDWLETRTRKDDDYCFPNRVVSPHPRGGGGGRIGFVFLKNKS